MRLNDLAYGDIVSFTDDKRRRRVIRVQEIFSKLWDGPCQETVQSTTYIRGFDQSTPNCDTVVFSEHGIDNLYKIADKRSLVVVPETIFTHPTDLSGDQMVRMYLASHMTESARRVYGTARWDEKAQVIVIPPVVHDESLTVCKSGDEFYLRVKTQEGKTEWFTFKIAPPREDDCSQTMRADLSRTTLKSVVDRLVALFPAP